MRPASIREKSSSELTSRSRRSPLRWALASGSPCKPSAGFWSASSSGPRRSVSGVGIHARRWRRTPSWLDRPPPGPRRARAPSHTLARLQWPQQSVGRPVQRNFGSHRRRGAGRDAHPREPPRTMSCRAAGARRVPWSPGRAKRRGNWSCTYIKFTSCALTSVQQFIDSPRTWSHRGCCGGRSSSEILPKWWVSRRDFSE